MADGDPTRTIAVNAAVLDRNQTLAAQNRAVFDASESWVVNLLSSPGSGKTSLLERTLSDLADSVPMAVVVGDLATDNDAARLRDRGAPVVQITTGDVCHLDASMVARAVEALPTPLARLIFIENVGNMVCPVAFYLGEHRRATLMSVTEGEDKPLKYPAAFRTANVVIVSKVDLSEAVGFDRASAMRCIRAVAPDVPILELSARTGTGMSRWYDWLSTTMGRDTVNGDTGR
jgi:hydrogenase nickel incorporation protein HypB